MMNTTTTYIGDALPIFERVYRGERTSIGPGPVIALGDRLTNETLAGACGLIDCDDWDAADYRFPTSLFDIACIIRWTGRRPYLRDGSAWVRGRITWVGDGEPDREGPCWIRVS